MIELILTVCLIAAPGACREERPDFGGGSVVECFMQGQIVASQWLATRPAYTLTRWRCEANVPRQHRI